MFKKKIKEVKITERESPVYYDERTIRAAIGILNSALETGQITHKNSYPHEKGILVVAHDVQYYDNDIYLRTDHNQLFPILSQMEIKSKEVIEMEKREEKEKELAKLQACQAKDLAEIERLARELGKK